MKLRHKTHWVAVWTKTCHTAHVLWWKFDLRSAHMQTQPWDSVLFIHKIFGHTRCKHCHQANMFVTVSEVYGLNFSQPQTHWLSPKLVCLDLCWWDTPTLHNTPSLNTPLSAKAEGRSDDMPLASDDKDFALSTTCHARSSAKPFHISSLEASEGKLWMH